MRLFKPCTKLTLTHAHKSRYVEQTLNTLSEIYTADDMKTQSLWCAPLANLLPVDYRINCWHELYMEPYSNSIQNIGSCLIWFQLWDHESRLDCHSTLRKSSYLLTSTYKSSIRSKWRFSLSLNDHKGCPNYVGYWT